MTPLIETIKEKFPKTVPSRSRGRVVSFEVSPEDLKSIISFLLRRNFRFLTMAGNDERQTNRRFTVSYVFGLPKKNQIVTLVLPVDPERSIFPSVFGVLQSARLFELEIMDMFGLTPEGNPELIIAAQEKNKERRLVHHHNWPKGEYPLRKDFPWNRRPKEADVAFPFLIYSKESEVFEIPVGPFHAGVIEPGHFRFTAVGEMILNLKIRLFYSHRGAEKLFEQKSPVDAVKLAERISGDTSFGHSLAFCEAVEDLANIKITKRAGLLRMVFLEMERLYNHVGDIGMIGVDASFAFAGAQGGRMKELLMRMNETLSGSRVLRGLNIIGGLKKDVSEENIKSLREFLASFEKDFEEFIEILLSASSLLDRLETTGRLKTKTAFDYNAVGVVARAAGLKRDARRDFPNEFWKQFHFKVPVFETGDVYARMMVRVEEVRQSTRLIRAVLDRLPKNESVFVDQPIQMEEGAAAFGIVEGWRGDIVYFVVAGKNNTLRRVKVRDTSFLNWPTVPRAILNNIVPDFPLCNKSYDLSYAGNDL